MSESSIQDVVIAGAGPVGLLLACELGLRDVAVLVLEQATDPHSPTKQLPFGLRGLSVPTLEAFYRRGLLDDIVAPSRSDAPPAHWMPQQRRAGGHFAGIPFFLDDVDRSAWPYRLPGPVDGSVATSMEHLESVLAARAGRLGVEIRRGIGVEGIEQDAGGVTVRAGAGTVRGRWLVGCDGGRSTVRKAAGFTFSGTEPEFTGYSVDVELADPILSPGRHYTATGMYTYQAPGTIAMVDFDGGACHRSTPTREHVQAVLRRVSGTDVTVTRLNLAATWTDRAFQATAYRAGRVLLAGDAAHIHSPLGGQGLNLGLGDAMNLGWKLASTLRDDMPETLLDSYVAERHPIGARTLDWSRAQVGIMRPSPSSRALAAIVRDLSATRDGATYFAERVWGMSLRHALGESHPLVGRSAPDFAFGDGSKLADHLRDGRGLLLDFGSDASLREDAHRLNGRVTYIAGHATDQLGLGAVLVRPDGVVAWAGDADVPTDRTALARAAARWFGDIG